MLNSKVTNFLMEGMWAGLFGFLCGDEKSPYFNPRGYWRDNIRVIVSLKNNEITYLE